MDWKKTLRTIVTALATVIAVFPIYWMITTSLKLQKEAVMFPPIWFPTEPKIHNYMLLFTKPGTPEREALLEAIGRGFSATPSIVPNLINSAIVASASTLGAVIVGVLAAYTISRWNTGGTFTYIFILATRMFPPVAIAIPIIVVFALVNGLDTHWGLSSIYMAVSVAYVVWIMKTFFDEIPKDIEDSAILCGLSRVGAFFKVVLPIVKHGLLTAALFVFLINWGEFAFALMFTIGGKAMTAPVVISHLQLGAGYQYGAMTALGTIAMIPAIIFGYIVQRYMVLGLTLGAVKSVR